MRTVAPGEYQVVKDQAIDEYGGSHGVRDAGLLDSAAVRPGAHVFGQEAYASLALKAAALLHSLVRNHALVDGNKRLGWVACAVLLDINGIDPTGASNDDVYALVMDVERWQTSIDVRNETVVYDSTPKTLTFAVAPAPTGKFVVWRYSLGNNWSSLQRSQYDDRQQRREEQLTSRHGAGDHLPQAVSSRRRHAVGAEQRQGQPADDKGKCEAGDPEPPGHEDPEGQHLHEQREHERHHAEGPDVAPAHHLERLGGRPSRPESVRGVGQAVEMHRPGERGQQGDHQRGGEERVDAHIERREAQHGREQRGSARRAPAEQPEGQSRDDCEEAADDGCEDHRPAPDASVDGARRPNPQHGERAQREPCRVERHSEVTRPATHQRTSSDSAATCALSRPMRSRKRRPEAVSGTTP